MSTAVISFLLIPISSSGCAGLRLTAAIRYDNQRGKGDHRHVGAREEDYAFTTLDALLADFERDVENWRTA